MTMVFASSPQRLCLDSCCHFSAEGNEIIAREMGKRMAEDLRADDKKKGLGY